MFTELTPSYRYATASTVGGYSFTLQRKQSLVWDIVAGHPDTFERVIDVFDYIDKILPSLQESSADTRPIPIGDPIKTVKGYFS